MLFLTFSFRQLTFWCQVCGVHPGRVLELRTNLGLMRAKAILEQQQQQQQREEDEEEDQKTRGRLKSARCM